MGIWGGGGGGGISSKLKAAAKKVVLLVGACGSLSSSSATPPTLLDPSSSHTSLNFLRGREMCSGKPRNSSSEEDLAEEEIDFTAIYPHNDPPSPSKNLCAICLEALTYNKGNRKGQAIFTAQCSHAFHLSCISSNVHHGNVTCPICRALWTRLPRVLGPLPCALSNKQTDPIFQILDDSIATLRSHRRSNLRLARYDDDDPVEMSCYTATTSHDHSRLSFSVSRIALPTTPALSFHDYDHHYKYKGHRIRGSSGSSLFLPQLPTCHSECFRSAASSAHAYLSVKLSRRQAMDLVLVASPNGPHLRLIKQSMALAVFSLRAVDRLAIVAYSSSAARVFPLRRMTSYGKRTALQVIDSLFYVGRADPEEGIKKGIKILEDRTHRNPQSFILHLSDCPTRPMSYDHVGGVCMQVPIPIHQFHLGFSYGTASGFIMHKFEEFLVQLLGGLVRDVQLRIGDDVKVTRLGELRGSEERHVLLDLGECIHVCVKYSYVELGGETRRGETLVAVGDNERFMEWEAAPHTNSNSGFGSDNKEADNVAGSNNIIIGGRTSSVESWGYHDPFMARRWAKHLHGAYRT